MLRAILALVRVAGLLIVSDRDVFSDQDTPPAH
jgi:hypothetical protein